jgi:hypothetical protein
LEFKLPLVGRDLAAKTAQPLNSNCSATPFEAAARLSSPQAGLPSTPDSADFYGRIRLNLP